MKTDGPQSSPLDSVLVLGGGTAGLLSAFSVKSRNPSIDVTLVRSPEIGTIQVGEGSFPSLPKFLHGYLGLNPKDFYAEVEPTWKLGIKFHWGPRDYFHYTFRTQFDSQYQVLPKVTGFYCQDEIGFPDRSTVQMEYDIACIAQDNGSPFVGTDIAYHLENQAFVDYMEKQCRRIGIEFVEDTLDQAIEGQCGVEEVRLASGRVMKAGLYLDCSGFRSELLGKLLEEPFDSYSSTLWCDKALVGGWDREEGDRIRPYTTSETMDAGWSWKIEHRNRINRGYVFSSKYISEDQAEAEFRAANPLLGETRVVPFRSGIFRRAWVKNVVGVGNAAGFVEPLESTSTGQICHDAQAIAEMIADSDGVISEVFRDQYNKRFRTSWADIRRFLALHYKLNTQRDTDFWENVREGIDLAGSEEILEHYRNHGPSTLWRMTLVDRFDQFGIDGYLSMLIGMKAPCDRVYQPTQQELDTWRKINIKTVAETRKRGMRMEDAFGILEAPSWNWDPGFYAKAWAEEKVV